MVENWWKFRELSDWVEAGCIPGKFRSPMYTFLKFNLNSWREFFEKCKPGRDRGCVDELRNRKVSLLHPVELDMLANRVPGPV